MDQYSKLSFEIFQLMKYLLRKYDLRTENPGRENITSKIKNKTTIVVNGKASRSQSVNKLSGKSWLWNELKKTKWWDSLKWCVASRMATWTIALFGGDFRAGLNQVLRRFACFDRDFPYITIDMVTDFDFPDIPVAKELSPGQHEGICLSCPTSQVIFNVDFCMNRRIKLKTSEWKISFEMKFEAVEILKSLFSRQFMSKCCRFLCLFMKFVITVPWNHDPSCLLAWKQRENINYVHYEDFSLLRLSLERSDDQLSAEFWWWDFRKLMMWESR